MTNILNPYMQANYYKSFGVALMAVLMMIGVFSGAGIAQEAIPTSTPIPATAPKPPPPTPPNSNKTESEIMKQAEKEITDLELPPEPPTKTPNYNINVQPLPPADRIGVETEQQTPLSLPDAIKLALENNNDVELADADKRSSELDLKIARGGYIPQFVAESFYRHSTTPVASSLGGGANGSLTETSLNATAGLSGRIPFQGGSFTSSFNSNRGTTNNSFTSLNPQFPTSLKIEYTQPLFRGRKFDQTRREIEIAKKNVELTDEQFRQRSIEIVAQVETAYWDLTYALRNLQVQLDGFRLATEQVASNERQVEQGVLAPSDVVAANFQVATVEQNIYLAQQTVTQAENNLKSLILADRNSGIWSNPIVPITSADVVVPRDDINGAIITALANRPEIKKSNIAKEANEIDKRFFRDQTKPQIDLVGSYTTAGLAGTPLDSSGSNPLTAGLGPIIDRVNTLSTLNNLPPFTLPPTTGGGIPDNLNGGYFKSLSNLALQRYPTYQIGVRISFPIKNTVAEGNLGKVLVEESRIASRRDKTELTVETEVRNALQAVRSQESRLAAARNARIAAEQLYESEQNKNLAGTSTVFLVLQRQADLITARGREAQAQTDLNKAITQFYRSTGTTLKKAGVSIKVDIDGKKTEARIRSVFGDSLKSTSAVTYTLPK